MVQTRESNNGYISQAVGLLFKKVKELNTDTVVCHDKTTYTFSGKRVHRGLYRNKTGQCIHADINGALNILRKSEVIEFDENFKMETPIKLEVQKRKAVASRIA